MSRTCVRAGTSDPAHHRQGQQSAVIPLVPRTGRTIDLAVGERHDGPILVRHDGERLDRRTAHRWVRSIGKRAGIGLSIPTCPGLLSSWRHWMPVYRYETSKSPHATQTLERRPSTTTAARFDRHAAYVVVAFVAGG